MKLNQSSMLIKTVFVRAFMLLGLLVVLSMPSYAIKLNFDNLKDTVKKAKQASGKMSRDEEVNIGVWISSTLLGAAPLVRDVKLQQYVNRVGSWVAQQSDRKDLPWLFGVIASDNINAFAAPGGFIVITQGLFLELNSEAELAGVLAHEISHVSKRHHVNAMKKNARMDLFADILVAKSKKKDQKKINKIINAGTQLYARGLDRKDEYEADRTGVILAARAGYDPFALLDVLTTLDSINPQTKSLALVMKTHPPFSERIEKLDVAIGDKLESQASAPRLENRFSEIKQGLLKKLEAVYQQQLKQQSNSKQ